VAIRRCWKSPWIMANIEEHVSPDGRFRFLVVAGPDGDLVLSFDGYPWHTHADILAVLSGLDQSEAVRLYVVDLLNDESAIALWGIPGEVRDVWVSEDPAGDAAYPIEGEMIEHDTGAGTRGAAPEPHAARSATCGQLVPTPALAEPQACQGPSGRRRNAESPGKCSF
jgi:hypothetical protein